MISLLKTTGSPILAPNAEICQLSTTLTEVVETGSLSHVHTISMKHDNGNSAEEIIIRGIVITDVCGFLPMKKYVNRMMKSMRRKLDL